MSEPPILAHFSELAPAYDALICDVWGVMHNGNTAYPAACDALRKFRNSHGPVVLLSNAPRPAEEVEIQFDRFGVPRDCYDTIITSGVAARAGLAERAGNGRLALLHIGPERDRGLFANLPVDCVEEARAEVILNTGPFDDTRDVPEDYIARFRPLAARGLVMLCANPDLVVQRDGKLIWCAGALAAEYEKLGGEVVYYGKPKLPVYDLARAATKGARRILAIGDGLHTDIKGANNAGIDALFIADGIHGEELDLLAPGRLHTLFDKSGTKALAVMRALVW